MREILDEWTTWVQAQIGLPLQVQERILISLLIVIGLWLARRWVSYLWLRNISDVKIRYQRRKTITYVSYVLVVLLIVPLWLRNLTDMATFLGLLSAGLAIALRDPVTNLVGWAFILWRRPFVVGDRIQIGERAGDVIDLRIFQFTLMEIGNWVAADQSTGRVIHIPNGKVFTESLANYTRGFQYIWNEIPVLVTFESDWRKAKKVLTEIAQRHGEQVSQDAERNVKEAAQRYMLTYATLTPTVYTSVEKSGVLLTIRYLCKPHNRRNSTQSIWEEILSAFSRVSEIDFAYPTQRFYNARLEVEQEHPVVPQRGPGG